MNKKEIVRCIGGVLFAAAVAGGIFYGKHQMIQSGIAEKVLRFHVIANSDSETDQRLKLKVRDAVGVFLQDVVEEAEDKESCKTAVLQWIPEIEETARNVIEENGYAYQVQAEVAEVDFPVKTYGEYTFPAGRYEALRVIIGEGEGKNWWCVMYPNLCFANSVYEVTEKEGEKALREVLDEEEYEAVLKEGRYQIRLRFLDFFR